MGKSLFFVVLANTGRRRLARDSPILLLGIGRPVSRNRRSRAVLPRGRLVHGSIVAAVSRKDMSLSCIGLASIRGVAVLSRRVVNVEVTCCVWRIWKVEFPD